MHDTSEYNSPHHEREKIPFQSPDVVLNMFNTEDPKADIVSDRNGTKNTNEFKEAHFTKDKCKVQNDNTNLKVGDTKTEPNNLEVNEINTKENLNDNKNAYIIMRIYNSYSEQQRLQPRYQNQPNQWFGGYGQDPGGGSFHYDPSTRNYFVKFVMIIVLIMVIITAAFIAFVMATPDIKDTFRRHSKLLLICSAVLQLAMHYAFSCSPCTRTPPCNFICLILTVVFMSVLAAAISARYRTEILLYAALATVAVVFVCVLLACSKFDFTSWLLYVVVISVALSVIVMIVFAVQLLTGEMMKPLIIVLLVASTLLQVVVLTIELQMVIGGKSIELTEDDYALGAYMIYTSIMSLFLDMVQLIGLGDG